ncbi:MAG TPA: hypothetical protein VGA67_05530 [Candidatus Dojkabacteria bacterium]
MSFNNEHCDIEKQVDLFNDLDGSRMYLIKFGDIYQIFINDRLVVEDCYALVLKRVKQINRENGYHYFYGYDFSDGDL